VASVLEVIRSRRSVRRFDAGPVDDMLVDEILDAGRWAPSGLNNQPWRFAVITEQGLVMQLSRLTRYSRIVREASVLIAVFLDTAASYDRTKDVQAIGACIQNMLLAVHALGLGGVWLGEILGNAVEVRSLLGAPEDYELMAVIAVGRPSGPPPDAPGRKELASLVFFRK